MTDRLETHRPRWTALVIAAFALAIAPQPCATVAAQRPVFAVHVTNVEGPLARRDITRRLPRAALESCQNTLMGGTLRLRSRVTREGTLVVDDASASDGTEIRYYIPCVRRVLARVRLPEASAESTLWISILYPAFSGPSSMDVGRSLGGG